MASPRTASLALALTLAGLAAAPPPVRAAEDALQGTGVFKLVNVTTRALPGDVGYLHEGNDTRETNVQSLRLQLAGRPASWFDFELHYLNVKRDGPAAAAEDGSVGARRYRKRSLRRYLERPEPRPGDPVPRTVAWYHEVDRAWLRLAGEHVQATVGRQPIAWGVGRFWQPTDLFAAFAPTDLEREYKPGIDAALVEVFPSDFSSLALAHVLSPRAPEPLADSTVGRLRAQLGAASEGTLIAGTLQGEDVAGGSIETAWLDAGWRAEALVFRPRAGTELAGTELVDTARTATYAIVGVDFRFSGGLLLAAEIYHHTLGAQREADLWRVAARTVFREGRMPHLSRSVLGLALEEELTGLLRAGYSLLAAPLKLAGGQTAVSHLHQGTLTYSIGDNAEAVLSLLLGRGKGLDALGRPRSEFGHLPDALFARVQFFF